MLQALGWICAAFLLGFLLGGGNKQAVKRLNPVKAVEAVKTRKQSEEQQRIRQIEMSNFMNYTGDPQPDPKEVVARGR